MEFRALELDMEDLDLRDEGRSGDADGFWSQLGMPENLLDLLCEEILEPCSRVCPL